MGPAAPSPSLSSTSKPGEANSATVPPAFDNATPMAKPQPQTATTSSPLFYGWRVVGALFVMLAFSSGLGFYNQSVLLEALTSERGFSVVAASLATTLFFATSGVAGLGVASLVERFDVRFSVTGGTLLSAFALVLLGRVTQPWQLYSVFALFGCGFAGANLVAATTLITRWFLRRRALALAVVSTGLSAGGIVLTPLCARTINGLGLTRGTPFLALALIGGVLPICLWLLRDSPQPLGLMPDGDSQQSSPSHGGEGTASSHEVSPSRAIRSRFFCGLAATFCFGLGAQVGGIAHQFNLVNGHAGPAVAGLAISVLAAASVVGRLIAGWAANFVPLRNLTFFLILSQATALFFLGQADSARTALIASATFGLTVGSFLLMWPLLVAYAFGTKSYARIYSIIGFIVTLGVAAGPSAIGILHDHAGGYPNAFAAATLVSVISALCLLLAGPRPASDPSV